MRKLVHEEVDREIANKSVNIAIKMLKPELDQLMKGLREAVQAPVKAAGKAAVNKIHPTTGKQSVKTLIRQGQGVSSIPLADEGLKDFQKIAKGIADGILKSLPKQTTAAVPTDSISLTDIKDYADSDYKVADFNDSGYNTPALNDNINKNYNPLEYNNMSFDTQMYDYSDSMSENNIYNEPPEKLYRVQTGAFRNKDNADRMLNSLLIEGFPAFIVYDNGIYHVQVGAFRNLFNAIKMEQRLRRFRYNTYISYD